MVHTREKARQLHLHIAEALGLVQEIDANVNILATKLGLQSMSIGLIDMGNTTVKHQVDIDYKVYEICEKINVLAYTMTGLTNILGGLSISNDDFADNLSALQELATAMKTGYNEIGSLFDKLQADEGGFPGRSSQNSELNYG